MPNEEGGGGFLSQRIFGMPAIVVIGGVAILAYFILSRNKAPAASTSGGGGQVHTGKTVVQSGAVRINVSNDGGNPQPKPPHKKPGPGGGATKSFTVPKDESLAQFGASRHWSQDTLNVDMPAFKQPQGSTYAGQKLSPDFKLKKGDKIFRPIGN